MTTQATLPADPDFTGVVVSAKWRVERQIGKGNSTVWLCTDQSASTGLPPRAAKFVLDNGTVGRRRELEHLRSMKPSEHIVTLYDLDHVTYAGSRYVVLLLEHCEGGSLERRITSRECEIVAAHLLAALERIHTREPQLIHADIKPANVLRSGEDWKLADFDIAKPLGLGASSATNDGANTPAFMAPGQNDPNHRLTPADDIYSLGATLHYALTGTLLVGQPGQDPEMSTKLPPEWVPFIAAATRLIPSMRATIEELVHLIPHGGVAPVAPNSTATLRSNGGRRLAGAAWLVSAVVAASLLAGGVILASRSSDASTASTPTTRVIATESTDTTSGSTTAATPSSTSPARSTTTSSSPTTVRATSTTVATPSTQAAQTPSTTRPSTASTAAINPQAQDSLTYLKAVRPLNCATYNALNATSGILPLSYWDNRTFNSSNWQNLVAAKPALQAWADAMSHFADSSSATFRTVSAASLRAQVVRLRNVVQRIVDAQSPEEANVAAVTDPEGNTIMGIVHDIDNAAYLLRGDLGLPTDPAPSYSTDCNDYWLV